MLHGPEKTSRTDRNWERVHPVTAKAYGSRMQTKCTPSTSGTSRDFAGLRGTSRDFAGLRRTPRSFAGLRGTSWDFVGLRGISRDFAGLRGTSRDFAGLRGILYYYRGFDGYVFDWLDYWHDNNGNQMVEYSIKVDCLSCEQDKCKLAERPYGQLASGASHSE